MKSSKIIVAAAALSGLLIGSQSYAQTSSNGSRTVQQARLGAKAVGLDTPSTTHSCKGQNACKGQGGCKTGDQGCKGKNSCKGNGGCKTAGSMLF